MFNLDNVRMPKKPEKLDFPEDSSSIGNMLEYVINLLNSNPFTRVSINCRTNYPITTLSDYLLDLVSIAFPILCEEVRVCVLQIKSRRRSRV